MPGVTEQEIAQAKQMNLYQYMQLCEPDNFKPEARPLYLAYSLNSQSYWMTPSSFKTFVLSAKAF